MDSQLHLESLLAALRAEMAQGAGAAAATELDQTTQGRLSRMDVLQLQAMAINRQDRLRLQERKLEAAIERCRNGTYGQCCRCGEEIEPERLRADPATPFCADCVNPEN